MIQHYALSNKYFCVKYMKIEIYTYVKVSFIKNKTHSTTDS